MNTSLQNKIVARGRSQGFTLVEVMVGLALSLLSMLIIIQIFSVSDARKRVTSGAAEGQQTANVSLYQLSRIIRLGGAGLTQAFNVWGCPIQAFRSAVQILPSPAAFPAPFALVPQGVRAIPVLIHAGAGTGGSDIIVVIAANGETGQVALQVIAPPQAGRLTLQRTNGVRAQDLILMTAPAAIANCQVAQVDPTFNGTTAPTTLPLAVASTLYNTAPGLAIAPYDANSVALHLGATPIFNMFGINATNSLVQYDLLNLSGTPASTIADNVFDMRARYGVLSAAGVGPVTWQDPSVPPWDVASLTAGNATALNLVDQIRAVRISMVFRSTEPVADVSPPSTYTMFPDDTPITVAIPAASQSYRYQVYDTVIPLRNLRYATNPLAPFLPYVR